MFCVIDFFKEPYLLMFKIRLNKFLSFLLQLEIFIIIETTGNLNWMINYIVNMN